MGAAGGVASVFIFRDWRIAAGVMIDGINVSALATSARATICISNDDFFLKNGITNF